MSPITWVNIENELIPVHRDCGQLSWAAQPISQEAFLHSPVFEVLLAGNRGGGKSLLLLLDFLRDVNRGYGQDWRGVVFRQTYPQLKDIVTLSKKFIPLFYPSATFNEAQYIWKFPTKEELLFRHAHVEADYYNYHGWQIPWLGFEELTTWPNDRLYKALFSICRSSNARLHRRVRSTTNPLGPGMQWVKRRFKLPVPPGQYIGPLIAETDDKGNSLPQRCAVKSDLRENRVLLLADPFYIENLRASARSPAELAAWIEGSWDVIAGGMFDDVWTPDIHIVPDIHFNQIPRGWKLNRAYDHGQSKPFSVGWWLESNGEAITIEGRKIGGVPGDLIRFSEWYGCRSDAVNEGLRLTAREIARGIREREIEFHIAGRVRSGVADSSIFDDYEPGRSVAGDMKQGGVVWMPADKGPNSRSQGWQQMRLYLQGAIPPKGGTREFPGLFICRRCVDWTRTVPSLPRDLRRPDDVDTTAEDHTGDETRYRIRMKNMLMKHGKWK